MLSGLGAAPDIHDLIEQVKATVDCQKLVPDDGTREEFGRYVRQTCISPDHTDTNPTMLVYPDGVNCPACGLREDAIGIYRLYHPAVGVRAACEALLASEGLTLDGEAQAAGPRVERALDPELPTRYHFALAADQGALAGLMQMGFTPPAIRHFRLGLARVRVRLLAGEDAADAEWTEVRGQRVGFQWQTRFSVPVYVEGRLRQLLYRKLDAGQLGAKVTMEKDCGAHLFGQDEVVNAQSVVVCEGWGDKIIAWQWGLVAVTSTNGAGHWNSEWTEALGNVRRIYVVADADAAGAKMVARVKRDLPWARPLVLPWPAGSKKDLRDGWLAGWSRMDVLRLMRQSEVRSSWSVIGGSR